MARYPLNLPEQLKQEAEEWAARHGISLNQFIMWSVAEKVAALRLGLDDPRFPQVTYRRGAAGWPQPVLRGTGIRVQTIALASTVWAMDPDWIAQEYDLSSTQVREALGFYRAHQAEIDALIQIEEDLAVEHG